MFSYLSDFRNPIEEGTLFSKLLAQSIRCIFDRLPMVAGRDLSIFVLTSNFINDLKSPE